MEWLTCTERMLEGDLSWSEKMKDDIRRMDHEQSLKKYKERAPLIAEFREEGISGKVVGHCLELWIAAHQT